MKQISKTLILVFICFALTRSAFAQTPLAYWGFTFSPLDYWENRDGYVSTCGNPAPGSGYYPLGLNVDGAPNGANTYTYGVNSPVRYSANLPSPGPELVEGYIHVDRFASLVSNSKHEFGYTHQNGVNDDLDADYLTWNCAGDGDFTLQFWFRTHGNVNQFDLLEWDGPEFTFTMDAAAMHVSFEVDNGTNTPQVINHDVLLNELDRKSFGYYTDGEWHQVAIRYIHDGPIVKNELSIFVDGYTGGDFQKSFTNSQAGQPAEMPIFFDANQTPKLIFSARTPEYSRFDGDLDEIALWNVGLTDAELRTHYLEVRCAELNNTAYYYSPGPGSMSTSLNCEEQGTVTYSPPTFTNPGGYIADQFPVGYPSTGVTPLWDQVQTFPGARYQDGHTMHFNVPFIAAEQILGMEDQNAPGQTINATTAANATLVIAELAEHFNYAIPFKAHHCDYNGFLNGQNRLINSIIDYANNSGSSYPRVMVSLWGALNPDNVLDWSGNAYSMPPYFEAEDFWAAPYNTTAKITDKLCMTPNTVVTGIDGRAYFWRRDLPPALDPLTNKMQIPYYDDCSPNSLCGTTQPGSPDPSNKISFACPPIYAREDGKVLAGYMHNLLDELTVERIDMVVENGEELPKCIDVSDTGVVRQINALSLNPNLPADVLTYWTGRKLALRQAYAGPASTDNTSPTYTRNGNQDIPFFWYDNDGTKGSFSALRVLNTDPNSGEVYSTPYLYPQKPTRWWNSVNSLTGLDHIVEARDAELTSATPNNLMAPFVSPYITDGGTTYFVHDANGIRPGQWLGTMKLLAGMGAEFYHTFVANLYSNLTIDNVTTTFENRAEWFGWQFVAPAYAQGITSRWEDLLHSSTLLTGDRNHFVGPINQPTYTFWGGDFNYPVVVRQGINDPDKYVIISSIQTSCETTVGENTPRIDTIEIDLDATGTGSSSNMLTFETRRQGSVYLYERNTTSAVSAAGRTIPDLFYQLDRWHQPEHPEWWTPDFWFEAEVWDRNSAGPGMPEFERWTDHLGSTTGGDYSHFVSYLTLETAPAYSECFYQNDAPTVEYDFEVRDATVQGTMYAFVRARNKPGSPAAQTGLKVTVDADEARIDCISSTSFDWYRVELPAGGAYGFSSLTRGKHTLSLTALNSELEIDQVMLSTTPTRTDISYQTLSCPAIVPDFTWQQISTNPLVVEFTDASTNAQQASVFHWQADELTAVFGTGLTYSYTYPAVGTYTAIHTLDDTYCVAGTLSVANNLRTAPSAETAGTAMEGEDGLEVIVHPTPSVGVVRFTLRGSARGMFACELVDLSGKVLWQQEVEGAGPHLIDAEGLASGVYFLNVRGEHGPFTKKVALQQD